MIKKTLLLLTAAAAFLLAGCQSEPITPEPKPDPDPVDPVDPADPDPGIYSAEDFLAFAAAVNAGESTETWENAEGWINLMADIDFAGVESWTPVGNAVAAWGSSYKPEVTEGHAFTGKFDGNAHKIKNLTLVDEVTTDGAHFGLFGYVGKGAVVQNFVIDESCSLTVKSSAAHSAGMIAGVVYDASVRDITSYAPMTYKGEAAGLLHMALIGGIYANEEDCTVDSVHNNGKIVAENTKNLNAGATGIHAAGIVGFTNADTSGGKFITVSSCNNYGDMESQAGRTAGVVGAANASTQIVGCENRGNQLNSMPKEDGSRLGNIVCFTNNGSAISNCKNYGNLISTTSGRVGGIVSLASAGTYTNNENYGEIISDGQYRGVFFGYITAKTTWTGGKASGKLGKYNGGTFDYDMYPEAEVEKYLGKVGSSGEINASGIIYEIATGDKPVDPDPELDVEAGTRIFFIGNSFTKDAVELLPGLLQQKGITDIQLVHMYYGGRTVPEYVSGWTESTDYKCYVCNPGSYSWSELTGKSLAQVAATGKWDFVTIQEHTGRSIAWGRNADEKAAEIASVTELVGKVKAAQQAAGGSPKLYYILSQAYHNLAKAQSTDKNFTNTDEMWAVISAVGKDIVENCGFDGVISTGVMLQNLRTSGLNNANGLSRDGYHMDFGISRFGAACTVYETLLRANALDGIVCGPSADSFVGDTWTTAVTEKRAPVALHAARYAIANPYQVTDMEGEGKEDPVEPGEAEQVSITSASDLVAFAARVNSGDESARSAEVTLTQDIDLSGVDSWTPIGNVTKTGNANNATAPEGCFFSGSFDGGKHTISGFNQTATVGANQTWGLFGYVREATIKDLTLVASLEIEADAMADAGVVVGTAVGSTIDHVSVSGTVKLKGGKTDNQRVAMGGIAGFLFSTLTSSGEALDAVVSNCSVDLALNATSGSNTKNGATCVMFGGIAGFATNAKDLSRVRITGCSFSGSMNASIGRCSGILATSNYGAILTECVNNAFQINTFANGRVGQLTCIMGENCAMIDCVNNGDLTTTDAKTTAAGMVALMSHASTYIQGGSNTGTVIAGFDPGTDSSNRRFSGLICANFNAFKEVKDVVVSGGLGKYVDGDEAEMFEVTEENFFTGKYIGFYADSNASKFTGLTYVELK